MAETRLVRIALLGLYAAAVWACAAGFDAAWLYGLPPLVLASFRLRPPAPTPALVRLLPRIVMGLDGLVALLGLAWVLYVPAADALVGRVPGAVGLTLCILGALLVSWLASIPAHRGALPACLGALLSAAFAGGPRFAGPVVLAGLSAFALLAAGAPPRHRLARLGTSVLLSGGLAIGIALLLPWAQPFAESAIAGAINPTRGVTGFGGPARLGDVQSLARSERPMLRLYATEARRLRAETFTRFDGRTWSNPDETRERLAPIAGPAALAEPGHAPTGDWLARPSAPVGSNAPARTWVARLDFLVPTPPLFVPFAVRAVKAGVGLELGSGGALAAVAAAPTSYSVVAGPAASAPGPDCAGCLGVPEKLDPRLLALAQQLARDAPEPALRVRRTLRHLDECCRYTLDVGRFATREPLAEFLFEKRAGYCEYFASAAAILLRLQGVPTRYVKGLHAGAAPWHGDHFLVRESEAHAWIDARLPDGWIELDPTPAADYAAIHGPGTPGLLARAWEWVSSRVARVRAALASLDLGALGRLALDSLPLLFGLGVLFAAGVLVRRRRQRPGRPADAYPPLRLEVAAAIRRFDTCCARAGWPRPASRGLLDHLATLPQQRFGPAWRESARDLALGVYAETYAGRAVDAQQLGRLGAALSRTPPR